jgi:hypothetical protein
MDTRILAAAYRDDVFRRFVTSYAFNAFVEGMSRAVALFLPTSRVVSPEDRKRNPIPPVSREASQSLAVGLGGYLNPAIEGHFKTGQRRTPIPDRHAHRVDQPGRPWTRAANRKKN